MNKNDIVKIAVVLAVLMFLFQSFQYMGGGFNFGGGGGIGDENVSGTATFTSTIRTYDAVLVLPADTDQSLIDEIRNREDVRNVKIDQQGIVVDTETRDDVYPLALYLRSRNVSSVSVANIVLPDMIELQTSSGTTNITAGYGVVRVITEPLLEVDSEVTVSMLAVSKSGYLTSYSSPTILLESVALEMEAVVESLDHKLYTYTIPWESRNSITNLSGYGTSDYKKVDSIIFSPPLTVEQIMTKKQFPYITYIDAGSAQVLSSFDNITQVQSNFQDVSIMLPPSTLKITTNQTPDLPFNSTVSYRYTIRLADSTEYEFEEPSFTLDTGREYDINSTMEVTVRALAAGNRIVSVSDVSLPS
jgi:hypothetical protein